MAIQERLQNLIIAYTTESNTDSVVSIAREPGDELYKVCCTLQIKQSSDKMYEDIGNNIGIFVGTLYNNVYHYEDYVTCASISMPTSYDLTSVTYTAGISIEDFEADVMSERENEITAHISNLIAYAKLNNQ